MLRPWMSCDRDGRDAEAKVDINYLFLRQQTERSRADAAASAIARKIHEQLANEYERLIEDATEGRIGRVGSASHAYIRKTLCNTNRAVSSGG